MAATDLSNAPISNRTATMAMPRAPGGIYNLDETIAIKNGSNMPSLQFPQDIGKYYTQISIFDYGRQDLSTVGLGITPAQNLPGNKIFLPVPIKLIENQVVQYTEEALGTFAGGAVASTAGRALTGVAATDFNLNVSQVLGGIAADQAAGTAVGIPGAKQGLGIMQALNGFSPNEFATVLFKRPLYKKHQLEFKMSPQNMNEAVAIRKIILALKKASAPGMTQDQMVFTFPKILRIAYQPNPGYLYKFKPCVLEAVSVNYAGGGTPAFYRDSPNGGPGFGSSGNNPPESVDLALQLLELEYWIDNNFQDTNVAIDGEMAVNGPAAPGVGSVLLNTAIDALQALQPTTTTLTNTNTFGAGVGGGPQP